MVYRDDAAPVLTLTPGPVDAYPGVLRAMSRAIPFDYDRPYRDFYAGVIAKAQRALRTPEPPLVLQAEPVVGLEAAAASLIGPDDVVLNLVSGVYGRGFGVWARRHARSVIEIEVPFDAAIDPEAVRAALAAHPEVSVVCACHHETPAGTLNPIEAIGSIVAAHGGYFIVDAVSSFGGMDTDPVSARADLYVTGPAKCLGCPPGLTLLGISARAWARIAANPAAPRGSVLSLLDWHEAGLGDRPFPFTTSIAEMHGLDAALDLYFAEGPEAVWARHGLTAAATRAGIGAMGLALWPRSEAIAAPTVTVFRTPEGIEEAQLRGRIRSRYGVVLAPGRGPTADIATRIGHMGPAAQPIHALAVVAAIGGALGELGMEVDTGGAIEAALAVIARKE